jgi:hypothetical protein
VRDGILGSGKNSPGFVWIPAAVADMEIKAIPISQILRPGFVE